MSLAGKRAEFAYALSTVDGVKGHEYKPDVPRPGDAWPLLGALDRAEATAFYVSWRVLVFLPQDERKASEWIDSHHESLVDAIEMNDVGFVDRLEPVALTSQAGDQLALQISMRSE